MYLSEANDPNQPDFCKKFYAMQILFPHSMAGQP